MPVEPIERSKKEIYSFLKENYLNTEFTVIYNGEFFIASAHGELAGEIPGCGVRAVSGCEKKGGKIIFPTSDEWAKKAVSAINKSKIRGGSLMIHSQVMRLQKQLEYGLAGGMWNGDMYRLAKNILYFLHTKSKSIRLNIVKKCAQEYNVIQRRTSVPEELLRGYMNALCRISNEI